MSRLTDARVRELCDAKRNGWIVVLLAEEVLESRQRVAQLIADLDSSLGGESDGQ